MEGAETNRQGDFLSTLVQYKSRWTVPIEWKPPGLKPILTADL